MVGPTPSDDRLIGRQQIAAGFVALVAVSAGLIAVRAGSSPVEFAGALVAGALVGAGLVWYVFRLLRAAGRKRPR